MNYKVGDTLKIEDAWQVPYFFMTQNGDQLCCGLFFTENTVGEALIYTPILARKENGIWIAKVVRSPVTEVEYRDFYPTPEAFTDANVRAFNEWLGEEYGEDGGLTDYQEWIRDMNLAYFRYEYDFEAKELVLK